VVAALVLFGWLVHYIATLGPRNAAMEEPAAAPVALTQDQWRLAGEVAAWEERFREMEARGGNDPAMKGVLTHAIGLQQELLRHKPHAGPEHSRRLERLENAEASPLRATADTALDAAAAAAEREDWPEALAAYEQARTALTEVNQRFPRTRYADIGLLDRIMTEIASLEAAAALEVDVREKGVAAAQVAGQCELAVDLFQSAHERQVELNRRYPRSRFASTQRTDELDAKRQTMLAQDLLEMAAASDREAGRLIFKRQLVAAAAQIDRAAMLLDQLGREYPKSRAQPGALKIKLAYLHLRRSVHAALQDRVYAQLIPVPGEKNLLMLRTEVPQELYTRVLNTNPSRNTGGNLPVDSVDWAEAQEFCQRMSWLLGAPVRLPHEGEYRHAVGEGVPDAWTAENSGGRTRDTGSLPANTNGFCDLLGNVAEWLLPGATEATAEVPVAGGSYLNALAALQTVPVDRAEKAVRAATSAFGSSWNIRSTERYLAQPPSFTIRAYSAARSGITDNRLWRSKATLARAGVALICAKVTAWGKARRHASSTATQPGSPAVTSGKAVRVTAARPTTALVVTLS
jgi:hypothetical protein